jgi:hypothetical protein
LPGLVGLFPVGVYDNFGAILHLALGNVEHQSVEDRLDVETLIVFCWNNSPPFVVGSVLVSDHWLTAKLIFLLGNGQGASRLCGLDEDCPISIGDELPFLVGALIIFPYDELVKMFLVLAGIKDELIILSTCYFVGAIWRWIEL